MEIDVGARINSIIDDQNMRQAALAHKLDIPSTTFNGYMTGNHRFPLDVIVRVADELNTTSDYLLGMTKYRDKPLVLTKFEQSVMESFRTLTRDQKELILQNIRFMQEQNRR